jgi:alkane 1-monooxygenase
VIDMQGLQPQLPSGYATMMPIAMIPPLWRRIMGLARRQPLRRTEALAALGPRYAQRRRRNIYRDASPPL